MHTRPALRSLNNEGNLLYSGGEDKSIVVWAVDGAAGTGKLLNSLEGTMLHRQACRKAVVSECMSGHAGQARPCRKAVVSKCTS